jgi:hypothetical protein
MPGTRRYGRRCWNCRLPRGTSAADVISCARSSINSREAAAGVASASVLTPPPSAVIWGNLVT